MINKFFAYEGWYYRVCSFLADLVLLSFLFLFPALTIVLLGPALIALYQTCDRLYQERDIPTIKTYLTVFKTQFKRGLALDGLLVVYTLIVLGIVYSLMEISTYLSILSIILITFATLYSMMFILIDSLYDFDLKQTAKESIYFVLSSTANAIILVVLPVIGLLVFNKINLYLFICIGIGAIAYTQVFFFKRVVVKEERDEVDRNPK